MVWCDDDSELPGLHTGFALDANGQSISLLTRPDQGGQVQDAVTFGLQLPDHTIAREKEGSGQWRLSLPTPGSLNVPLELAPASELRINEWMPWPESGADWFELYNPNDHPAPLADLLLDDRPDASTAKPIAALSFIKGHGFRRLFADQRIDLGNDRVDFRLRASGETIGLFDLTGHVVDLVEFGEQVEGVSQGRYPDGSHFIMGFPGNATPGRTNSPLPDSDGDSMPDAWELVHGLAVDNPDDGETDLDGDGMSNRDEYWCGTSPNDARSLLRLETSMTAGEEIMLRFEARPGRTYSLLSKEFLVDGVWQRTRDWEAGP